MKLPLPALMWLLSTLLFQAKPTPFDVKPTGGINLHFSLEVDGSPLTLDSLRYSNRFGERFALTSAAFYVSNLRLLRPGREPFILPQDSSYFLIRAGDAASQTIPLPTIPQGSYAGIEFMVGVDRLRSVSNLSNRTGVLDPTEASERDGSMYWEWNSGYIFLKLEGFSPQAPLDPTGLRSFQYHIGGYGGYDTPSPNNLKRIQISFPQPLLLDSRHVTELSLAVNLNQVFNGPSPVRISQTPSVMFSSAARLIAENYATMFSFKSIHARQ